MDRNSLEGYISAWQQHVRAGAPDGGAELGELVGYMTTDVRYEDVPSGLKWVGHDGVYEMAKSAYAVSPDMTFEIVSRQCDGAGFAFEWICRGHMGEPAAPFEFRACSVGSLSPDGLVTSHADYWDLAGLRAKSD